MRGKRLGLLALGLILALATPALAADTTLHGTAGLPFEVAGAVQVTAAKSDFLVAGDRGSAAFTLAHVEGTATRVLERSFAIVDSRDPSAHVLWQQKVDRVDVPMKDAILSLSPSGRLDGFQLLAFDGPATFTPATTQSSTPVLFANSGPKLVESANTTADLVELVSEEAHFTHTMPAGLFVAAATDGKLAMNGKMKLFVSGAYLGDSGDAKGITAYERDEQQPGQIYNPMTNTWSGAGYHPEHIKEYLLVDAKAADLVLTFHGLAGVLYTEAPTLAIDGAARLPHMEGTVQVTDKGKMTTHTLHGEDLTIAGRFTLRPSNIDSQDSGTQVNGQGDVTAVTYGSVSAHYDWASTIAAVGIGAAAVAAIVWAVANGKTLLGLGGGGLIAGYARVHGDEILEHPGRAEVYERVKAFPGVNFVQLSDQVEFGTSTLNYHLRVLERNGFVISVRDGRYLRFFDRKSGHYSSGKKLAVSALRNTTTAAIAQHIRAHPGVAQCDLATAFGVTASTVTWHINRLAGAGLVEKSRDAHRTRYFLGDGWASLPADEQVRQGFIDAAPASVVA